MVDGRLVGVMAIHDPYSAAKTKKKTAKQTDN